MKSEREIIELINAVRYETGKLEVPQNDEEADNLDPFETMQVGMSVALTWVLGVCGWDAEQEIQNTIERFRSRN